jgi:hypothetical protein
VTGRSRGVVPTQEKTMNERTQAIEAFCAEFGGKVEVDYAFEDDHLLGCVIALGPNKVRVALPWIGWEAIGAFKYATVCKQAYEDARDALTQELPEDDLEEFTDPDGWDRLFT